MTDSTSGTAEKNLNYPYAILTVWSAVAWLLITGEVQAAGDFAYGGLVLALIATFRPALVNLFKRIETTADRDSEAT